MQHSSPTIGTIAAALAKAQAEIVNPGKSLTATIHSPFPRERDVTFRYAPLSAGLEIIRKSLSRHEIAIIQTTSIDHQAGLVRLATVLAHASGEWVSSDWPVCGVGETAAPHKMGAALTYARRYALFTLVGIAGDDDLDAPDLLAAAPAPAASPVAHDSTDDAPRTQSTRPRRIVPRAPQTQVAPSEAASLRERLLAEIAALPSAEDATEWIGRMLPLMNGLPPHDVRLIDDAFAARRGAFGDEWESGVAKSEGGLQAIGEARRTASLARPPTPKCTRIRDHGHRAYVASQPCVICGRSPSDAHHLRFAQPRALGRKVSDEFTVPLCRTHHRQLHRTGDEKAWWEKSKIDPVGLAAAFWMESRGSGPPGNGRADEST